MMHRAVTPGKLMQMKAELDKMEAEYRKKSRGMNEAAAHGGASLSKIPEYEALKESLRILRSRIDNLREEINNSRVIRPGLVAESDRTSVLSIVQTVDVKTGDTEKYCFGDVIITPESFDGTLITQESPIGRALIGKRVDDVVVILTPNRKSELRITAIIKAEEV